MRLSDGVLRAFVALAETGQFTLAARQCHMTQPALSQLIGRLEQHLGVYLFERGARRAQLTVEGERLLPTARLVLRELDAVRRDLRAYAELERGHVSVAVVPSLAAFWMPDVLKPFHARHRKVGIRLIDASSERCAALTRQGDVDMAVSSQPGSDEEVESELLFEEPMYLAVPADAVRLAAGPLLRLADLRGVEMVNLHGLRKMLVRTAVGYGYANDVLSEAGIVDSGLEVEQVSTQAGLVAAGLGACLVPACSLEQFAKPDIVASRLDPGDIVRPVYLSRRRGSRISEAARALAQGILEHARRAPPGS